MVGKKKGKLKAVDTFRMALKYETLTKEGRRADRLDRYRWREAWERGTIERRFCYTTATTVAVAMEEQEDTVLKVVTADFAGKDAVLRGMRRTATDLQKVYLQLKTASKYGFNIAEKFFERKSIVQGLTDEQEKLLNKIIKEESGESSIHKHALPVPVCPGEARRRAAISSAVERKSSSISRIGYSNREPGIGLAVDVPVDPSRLFLNRKNFRFVQCSGSGCILNLWRHPKILF